MKQADLSHLFDTLKRKMSGQEFKDLVRSGWECDTDNLLNTSQ